MPYFLCIAFQSFKIKVDSFRILFFHRSFDEGGVYFGQPGPFLWNKKKANDDWFLCQIGSFCVDRRGRDILELCRRVPLYHCHPSFLGLQRQIEKNFFRQNLNFFTPSSYFLSSLLHVTWYKKRLTGLLPGPGWCQGGLSQGGTPSGGRTQREQ